MRLGLLGALPFAAVACGPSTSSPFSDLESVCGQGLPSLAAYVSAFEDLGWREVPPAHVQDEERAAMIDAMTYAGLGRKTALSPELLRARRSVAKRRILSLLTPHEQTQSILKRRDGDQSVLMLSVNARTQGNSTDVELSCTLMGVAEQETAWIASLLEERRMRSSFTEVDPDANFSNRRVSPVSQDAPPNASGALFYLYPDLAEAALGTPLRYDLVFVIGTWFRLKGKTQ
ncbi:MAG: hypothetical protein AAF484_10685 [Pseudomonadota bacterium]